MKLEGFPGVDVTMAINASGTPIGRAAFTYHGITPMDEMDDGDEDRVMVRAARLVMAGVGLLVALRYDLDILRFINVSMAVKQGDEIGRVEQLDVTNRSVRIVWSSGARTTMPVDTLAANLRHGALTLP